MKDDLEKELLKYHWWYDLDNHGIVHINHFGFNISIRECKLYEIAKKHGIKKSDVTILIGG